MENYKLIKKWLGLEVFWISTCSVPVIDADKLEAKLEEGFEVYLNDYGSLATKEHVNLDHKRIALGIGLQPIKKQTQAEASLKFIHMLYNDGYLSHRTLIDEAKQILEMKDE